MVLQRLFRFVSIQLAQRQFVWFDFSLKKYRRDLFLLSFTRFEWVLKKMLKKEKWISILSDAANYFGIFFVGSFFSDRADMKWELLFEFLV